MKSLQTIQKTFRVFQTLVRIAMVASFVWAGLSVLGLLCAFAWHSGVTVVGLSREALLALTLTGSLSQMVGVLLADAAFALTDGVLLLSAFRYFKAEQEAGTPFTRDGADAIRTLGVRTIVLLLAAAVFSTLTYEFFWPGHGYGGGLGQPGQRVAGPGDDPGVAHLPLRRGAGGGSGDTGLRSVMLPLPLGKERRESVPAAGVSS